MTEGGQTKAAGPGEAVQRVYVLSGVLLHGQDRKMRAARVAGDVWTPAPLVPCNLIPSRTSSSSATCAGAIRSVPRSVPLAH